MSIANGIITSHAVCYNMQCSTHYDKSDNHDKEDYGQV